MSCYAERMRTWIAFVALSLSACQGFGDHHSSSSLCDTSGVLFINWTFAGKAPSATACTGIDHLTVSISPDDYHCNAVTISPLVCELTRFRYDNVPRGISHLDLTSFDANGLAVSQGSTPANLTTDPSNTVAIDLR